MRTRFTIISLFLLAAALAACGGAAEPAATTEAPAALPTTAPASSPYPAPATLAPTPMAYPEPTSLPPTAPALPTIAADAAPLRPGDQLGDFLITTAQPGEARFGWDGDCKELPRVEGETLVRYTCALALEVKFNPCSAAYSFGSGKSLDEIWAEFKYELWINGRPVDLPAFGTVDLTHPQVGAMRAFNVVIVASQPGEIVIEDITTMPGQPAIHTTATLTFAAP